jgi:hypothetical protein
VADVVIGLGEEAAVLRARHRAGEAAAEDGRRQQPLALGLGVALQASIKAHEAASAGR